tara:strand:+ start:1084 stop:1530 length:447 start_codon:yes stop_codon:yes gene_type:complete
MKPKTKKIAIGVGAAAVIGAILYFLLRKKDSSGDATRSVGGLSVPTGGASSEPEVEKKIWVFTDNYFTGGFSDSGNLGFVGTDKPPFSVGEVIYVTQSDGAKYPQYDGMTKIDAIKEVDAGWVVDTTKSRQGNTPVNSGIITNYKTDA